jgi:4-amino-4-deoxy-L-arabinose transferase-like glycosyltransferase
MNDESNARTAQAVRYLGIAIAWAAFLFGVHQLNQSRPFAAWVTLIVGGVLIGVLGVGWGLWVERRGPRSPVEKFEAVGAAGVVVVFAVLIMAPFAKLWSEIKGVTNRE